LKVGVLCPETVVHKMLEKYFGFEKYLMLRIHGIDVNTKEENKVTVTIKLNRPGLLIGKEGTTLISIENLLEKYFKMTTDIKINEVQELYNPLYSI
jgi:ribosomal protein S3